MLNNGIQAIRVGFAIVQEWEAARCQVEFLFMQVAIYKIFTLIVFILGFLNVTVSRVVRERENIKYQSNEGVI